MSQGKIDDDLAQAAATRDEAGVRQALAAGADPNATLMDSPVLHVAVGALDGLYYERGGRPKIPLTLLDALLEAGADLTAEVRGIGVLASAAPHRRVVEHLLRRGAPLGSDGGTRLLALIPFMPRDLV